MVKQSWTRVTVTDLTDALSYGKRTIGPPTTHPFYFSDIARSFNTFFFAGVVMHRACFMKWLNQKLFSVAMLNVKLYLILDMLEHADKNKF
jgi:hypothetical protein